MRLPAFLLSTMLLASPGIAETVHFPSATTPPTPLQQRLARERGQPIAPQPTTDLVGDLHRPEGTGPFAAIVALHGCGGRGPRPYEEALAERFTALGYAILFVDSFAPRGITERCHEVASSAQVDRVMDAYGGLLYLANRPFVDPDRIAVVGYSQGAMVTLSAISLGGVETLFDRHFRTAIAYYPGCSAEAGSVSIPTLILIGALDDWTPARDCERMMARRTGEGAPLRLIVYPGAYHAFNARSLIGRPHEVFGHHVEYNEAADTAAWGEMTAALRQAFGR